MEDCGKTHGSQASHMTLTAGGAIGETVATSEIGDRQRIAKPKGQSRLLLRANRTQKVIEPSRGLGDDEARQHLANQRVRHPRKRLLARVTDRLHHRLASSGARWERPLDRGRSVFGSPGRRHRLARRSRRRFDSPADSRARARHVVLRLAKRSHGRRNGEDARADDPAQARH